MNSVNLMGRFGSDPKSKVLEKDGRKFTSMYGSIAVPHINDTYWINIHATGTTADNIVKYFKKGDRIALTGELATYKDASGNYTYNVEVKSFDFVEKKEEA